MKKILGLLLMTLAITASAQNKDNNAKPKAPKPAKVTTPKQEKPKPDYTKLDLSKRASDHLLLQFGATGWSKPGNITVKGFNRSFNGYFMFDFPFKSNPRYSVAIGPGIGSDNMILDQMSVDLNDRNGALFTRDTITRYKKNKFATSYLEAPLELRFSSKPDNMNSGWKLAIGVKVGTLLDAKVKSKVDLDATGTGGYYAKEKDKRFLNSTRVAFTARAGLGNFSIFGSYQVTAVFKEGLGPVLRPWTIGVTLSGL